MRTVASIVAAASLVLLAGCAASNSVVTPDTAMVPAPARTADAECPKQAGSRIATNGANCSGFGRTYSSDDISRTGSTTMAGALRLLDPALTIH